MDKIDQYLSAYDAASAPPLVLLPGGFAASTRTLTMPVLVVLAARSKVHSIARVEAGARAGIRDLTIRTLPQATHFTLLAEHAQELNHELLEFLG